MIRRNEDVNQLIDQRAILALMLHGEEIQLIVQPNIQIGRLDLQRVIHEHVIKPSIAAFVFSNIELIAVLTEIQVADDAVQLVLSLQCFLDGTADLVHEVVLKMLHRCLRLFRGTFPVFLEAVTGKIIQ